MVICLIRRLSATVWGMNAHVELPADPDALISAAVRALAAGRGITHAEVVVGVGMALSTFERRLAKGGWTAAEVIRLAAWFDVPIEDLTTGLGGHVGGQR